MKIDYTNEYEAIKPYAEMIGHKYATRAGRYNSWRDLTQQYYALYFDPKIIALAIIENKINRKYAHFIVKQRLKDYILSRKWNHSYCNTVEHVSIEALLEVDGGEVLARNLRIDINASIDTTLINLLGKLNDRQYKAIVLTKIYGYTQEEAAEKMLCSRSMISKYTIQAMEIMRSYI